VIRQVKSYIPENGLTIIDAPPGTTCPMVESVKDSDYCLLVTEPTPFGLHDLRLAVEVLRKLRIPFGVLISRAGLGDDRVERYCAAEEIPILLQIPFSRKIAEAYSRGLSLVEAMPEFREKLQTLFERIRRGEVNP
jgi:MinD superfamily P-loop ATPase